MDDMSEHDRAREVTLYLDMVNAIAAATTAGIDFAALTSPERIEIRDEVERSIQALARLRSQLD